MVNVKWRTNKRCRQWNCPLKSLQLSPLCCKWSFTALETDCGLKISCTAQAIRVCVCVYVCACFPPSQKHNRINCISCFDLLTEDEMFPHSQSGQPQMIDLETVSSGQITRLQLWRSVNMKLKLQVSWRELGSISLLLNGLVLFPMHQVPQIKEKNIAHIFDCCMFKQLYIV